MNASRPRAAIAAAGPGRRKVPVLRRILRARGRSLEITRAGKLFILLTLAVGFAAINSGANLLHAIFGAMMAVIIASGMLSDAWVGAVAITRRAPGPLVAGHPGPLEVTFTATGTRPVFGLSVEDDDLTVAPIRTTPAFALYVPEGRSVIRHATVTAPTRGRHRLPPAVVATRAPFGLFVKRRALPRTGAVLVLPRPAGALPAPAAAPKGAHTDAGPGAARRARTGPFHGLRPYRSGDDPRRIHWPATARSREPVVRTHEHPARGDVVLHLTPGRTGEPAFEAAVSRVTGQALRVAATGHARLALRYGAHEVVGPGRGPGHLRRVLTFLALCGEGPAA